MLKELSGKIDLKNVSLIYNINLEFISLQSSKNLNIINNYELTDLKGFMALMCKDFSDLTFLSNNIKLEALLLELLPNIEKLPDFSKCAFLKSIKIITLNKLKDISSLKTATNLERLLITNCRNIGFDEVKFLNEHPSLKYIGCDSKSITEINKMKELFGDKYNIKEVNNNVVLSP